MPSPSSVQWLSALISLVGSVWLQAINGPNSDFPVYSSQLKGMKGISQVQLNLLAFASDAGKLFGWLPGVAARYLPLWLVAFVGAALVLVGYGIQCLFLDRAGLQYWHMFLLTALAGNGICWINTVCYLVCIRNLGTSSRRVAVSLVTSYLGLSAKVYTSLADSIPDLAKAKGYLLLNAVVPMLVTLVVSPSLWVVGDLTSTEDDAALFLAIMFAVTVATGACGVVGSIGSTSSRLHHWMTVSLAVLLATPILIPLVLRIRDSLSNNKMDLGTNNRIIDMGDVESTEEGRDSAAEKTEKQQDEVGGLRLLTNPDFWLYFLSYMFSCTLGLVYLSNLGQIAESRQLAQTSTLISLSSSFGFFGRLLPSFLDYYSAKRGCYSISSTGSMALLMVPMAGAFFLLLNPSDLVLYLSTAVIGTCTGAIASVAASATSELFGTKHFAVNHNVVATNIPVGSLCFGYLAAYVYQRGADNAATSAGQTALPASCIGAGCYKDTFLAWGATCAVGTLLCALLYVRSSELLDRRPAARTTYALPT